MRAKRKVLKYEELWNKIRDLIKSVSIKISDDYDEKYMEIKFNLDDKLPLNKMIEILSMIMVVSTVFHENIYYPRVFKINVCISCK